MLIAICSAERFVTTSFNVQLIDVCVTVAFKTLFIFNFLSVSKNTFIFAGDNALNIMALSFLPLEQSEFILFSHISFTTVSAFLGYNTI